MREPAGLPPPTSHRAAATVRVAADRHAAPAWWANARASDGVEALLLYDLLRNPWVAEAILGPGDAVLVRRWAETLPGWPVAAHARRPLQFLEG